MLDKNNNPLTHAKYHREQVKEAEERERRPLPLEVPEYLKKDVREYLAQVSHTWVYASVLHGQKFVNAYCCAKF